LDIPVKLGIAQTRTSSPTCKGLPSQSDCHFRFKRILQLA
jgi:hypothetical protein